MKHHDIKGNQQSHQPTDIATNTDTTANPPIVTNDVHQMKTSKTTPIVVYPSSYIELPSAPLPPTSASASTAPVNNLTTTKNYNNNNNNNNSSLRGHYSDHFNNNHNRQQNHPRNNNVNDEDDDDDGLTMFEKFFSPKYGSYKNKTKNKNKKKSKQIQNNSQNHASFTFFDFLNPNKKNKNDIHNTHTNGNGITNNTNANEDMYITNHGVWPLPPGWTTIQHEADGRIYYFHAESGTTRWTHPNAPVPPIPSSSNNTNTNHDSNHPEKSFNTSHFIQQPFLLPPPPVMPRNDNRKQKRQNNINDYFGYFGMNNSNRYGSWWKRPDSHQCCSFLSCIVCPIPMGLCAMYHSFMVNRTWSEGRHGDALDHSRQAYNYACWGTVLATCIFMYWFFIRDGSRWDIDWPDWDFNFD